ncbi:unnamed protein product [Rotaria sp. Silwood1]|nr:unnamed protein product [Rotaria sp. Silwood1]
MVFENIVVYLLDKYLGDYIENLDTKKLKIDLWSGHVVLENLYLKSNALADLNLPVTISIGYLQKLTLQVPWKNLYTYPTKATIDGLFLLVVPKTEVQYDAQKDEKEQHEAKMKEVRQVEELRKQKEAEKNAKENDKTNDTFVERMQLQIIRNLELSIRNIHIVYEDKSTKPDHPFALGITLNYITLHTTTSDWEPTILKEDTPLIHKLGELSAFSIYWNTNAKSRTDLSRDEAINTLREKIAIDNQQVPSDVEYILRPLNIKARLILTMKPRQEGFKRPMFDIKIDLDEISLNMSRNQYSDLLDLLEFQDYLIVRSKYIKYHIEKDKQESASLKNWKFAYEAIVNEEIRPRFECYKWENIKAHLDRCREYRTIHLQELTGKLTNEQKKRAEELEKKLDVFNLTYIRRSAEIEAKKKQEQEPKTWWGSVSNWWGGNKHPDDPELDLEKVMSPEEKKKLYDAIGYAGEDTSTSTYPEEIVSQQGDQKELLRVTVSLFNYPDEYEKPVDVVDCDVKVQFAKANIIFLFKHIDAILIFLDSLNITKAALDLASAQADAAYEQVQKLQEQAFKVHLDITFNAPNIIIPTNSYSDEALLFDLGKLTLKTRFYDDPKRSLIEQQNVRLENVLASRVKLNNENNILGEVILLECAELNILINRLLYPEKIRTEPGVSIKAEWELVHFQLAKGDYSCIMKVLMDNFTENIRNQILPSDQIEQYHYRVEEREKEEEALRNAVIQGQHDAYGDDILQTVKFRAEIKKLALTLYLGESDLTVRRAARNENLILANVEIEMLEALFRQLSDTSYKAMARFKNLLLDDLRVTNKLTSLTRMMDRHFTVDPNTHMFIGSFEFKPKSSLNPVPLRQLSAQLESLYICISLDYLMTLQDFFISGLPSNINNNISSSDTSKSTKTNQIESEENRVKTDERLSRSSTAIQRPSTAPSKASVPQSPYSSSQNTEIETHVDVIVKNPEIILLEDQHNPNSNCLVLDLALQMRMITVDEDIKLYGWLKDLTVYSSNFAELKNSRNSNSKIKYRILQPAKADVIMILDNKQQKIDVRISDIIVSIAPAAVRTLIGVTSSLGTLQTTVQETEKVNVKTLFKPKPFKDANFWFTQDAEEKEKELETVDILETVTGLPSQLKEAKEEEKKRKENEENIDIQKPLIQQLIFTLETIEVKLEVGLGSITKSVVAMCLSNLTADIKNWSSELSLSSTVNVEAALFNERMLTWEPLIEPTINETGNTSSPWCITCSIIPVLPGIKSGSAAINEQERKEGIPPSNSKQIISIRADQLLNITITKGGLNLLQRLSDLFNDVYNKRLLFIDDDDQPMLSLFNGTGQEINIEHLDGLEIGPIIKTVSISRTWKRVYNLGLSSNPNQPIEMLCDAQIRNNRRYVTLSSILKIYNNTTMSLAIISIDSIDTKQHRKVTTIHVNDEYHVPIDLLYAHSTSLIFIAIDE